MTQLQFTQEAMERLSPEEKMEVRVAVFQDGSLAGWAATSSQKTVAWKVHHATTMVGMLEEAPRLQSLEISDSKMSIPTAVDVPHTLRY